MSQKAFHIPDLEDCRISTKRTTQTTNQRAQPETSINDEVFCG